MQIKHKNRFKRDVSSKDQRANAAAPKEADELFFESSVIHLKIYCLKICKIYPGTQADFIASHWTDFYQKWTILIIIFYKRPNPGVCGLKGAFGTPAPFRKMNRNAN